jgi:hypothetical protein
MHWGCSGASDHVLRLPSLGLTVPQSLLAGADEVIE